MNNYDKASDNQKTSINKWLIFPIGLLIALSLSAMYFAWQILNTNKYEHLPVISINKSGIVIATPTTIPGYQLEIEKHIKTALPDYSEIILKENNHKSFLETNFQSKEKSATEAYISESYYQNFVLSTDLATSYVIHDTSKTETFACGIIFNQVNDTDKRCIWITMSGIYGHMILRKNLDPEVVSVGRIKPDVLKKSKEQTLTTIVNNGEVIFLINDHLIFRDKISSSEPGRVGFIVDNGELEGDMMECDYKNSHIWTIK